jgi:hypothetical protein
MRMCLYTEGQRPRVILSLEADLDMISQLVCDEEFDPETIAPMVKKALEKVREAVIKGLKRKEENAV